MKRYDIDIERDGNRRFWGLFIPENKGLYEMELTDDEFADYADVRSRWLAWQTRIEDAIRLEEDRLWAWEAQDGSS